MTLHISLKKFSVAELWFLHLKRCRPGQFQRWDPRLPLDYNNVVLFTRPQARRHEQHVLSCNADPTTYWGPVVSTKVQQRMKEELRMSHWR